MRNPAAKDIGVAPVGILEYLNAATGADYTLDELVQPGERIINAERPFLVRAGFSRQDDALPERLTRTPAPTGPANGRRVDETTLPSTGDGDVMMSLIEGG